MIVNILMILWVLICIVILILSIVNFFTLRKLKTQVNTGNISIGSGLISNSIVSVGTTWVDVPNTQPRGAYLILARSEVDGDSALVASVSDGYINVMAREGDATTNYYLDLQYPSNSKSNMQIKMSNGNTRNVSILVIRA